MLNTTLFSYQKPWKAAVSCIFHCQVSLWGSSSGRPHPSRAGSLVLLCDKVCSHSDTPAVLPQVSLGRLCFDSVAPVSHVCPGSLQMTQQMVPADDLGIEGSSHGWPGLPGKLCCSISGVRSLGVSIWVCFSFLLLLEKSPQCFRTSHG